MTGVILDSIDHIDDLRKLSIDDLKELSIELRHYIIDTLSQHPGHLASSLGVVELTLALHYVFNTPDDKLIWDVGHQAYAHKIITGRRDQFPTIRTYGGLSGFPRMDESPFDMSFESAVSGSRCQRSSARPHSSIRHMSAPAAPSTSNHAMFVCCPS